MIAKRYQLYLTDATHRILNDLVENGHNIRDVLNSGVILFLNASHQERGVAHMEAYSQPKKDFRKAMNVIFQINIDSLNPDQAKLAQAIRNHCGPDYEQSAAAAIADEAAAGDASGPGARRGKRGPRTG